MDYWIINGGLKMLIIKAKHNLPREKMKNIYRNLLEQMQLGLIFIDDNYEISVVEPSMKWIPISEKSPNDGEWAIFTDGTQMSIERYKMDALDHFYPSGRWFNLEDAVAWMPLPELYKAEREDKA